MYWPRAGISAYPSLPSTAPPITRFLLFAGRFRPRTRKRPAEPGAPLDSFNERTNTTYMASASAHPRWRRARRSGIERRPGGERPPARAGLRTRRRGRHRRSDRDAARTAAMSLAQNLRLAWQRVTGRTTGCRHVDQIRVTEPVAADACPQCLAAGDGWRALRICASCGQIGCCDSSKNLLSAVGPADQPAVLETRSFGSGVAYSRYQRVADGR